MKPCLQLVVCFLKRMIIKSFNFYAHMKKLRFHLSTI